MEAKHVFACLTGISYFFLSIASAQAPGGVADGKWITPFGGMITYAGGEIVLSGQGDPVIAIFDSNLPDSYSITGETLISSQYAGFILAYDNAGQTFVSVYSSGGDAEFWTNKQRTRTSVGRLPLTWSKNAWNGFSIQKRGATVLLSIGQSKTQIIIPNDRTGTKFGLIGYYGASVRVKNIKITLGNTEGAAVLVDSAGKSDTLPPSPPSATETLPVMTPQRLAPKGIYYLLQQVSIPTDSGVVGLKPGTLVKQIGESNGKLKVKSDDHEFEVERFLLTNDLDIAAAAANRDAQSQNAVRAYLKKQQDASAGQQEAQQQNAQQQLADQNERAKQERAKRIAEIRTQIAAIHQSLSRTTGGPKFLRNDQLERLTTLQKELSRLGVAGAALE